MSGGRDGGKVGGVMEGRDGRREGEGGGMEGWQEEGWRGGGGRDGGEVGGGMEGRWGRDGGEVGGGDRREVVGMALVEVTCSTCTNYFAVMKSFKNMTVGQILIWSLFTNPVTNGLEDQCKHCYCATTLSTALHGTHLHDRVGPDREVKLVPRVYQSVHH